MGDNYWLNVLEVHCVSAGHVWARPAVSAVSWASWEKAALPTSFPGVIRIPFVGHVISLGEHGCNNTSTVTAVKATSTSSHCLFHIGSMRRLDFGGQIGSKNSLRAKGHHTSQHNSMKASKTVLPVNDPRYIWPVGSIQGALLHGIRPPFE